MASDKTKYYKKTNTDPDCAMCKKRLIVPSWKYCQDCDPQEIHLKRRGVVKKGIKRVYRLCVKH